MGINWCRFGVAVLLSVSFLTPAISLAGADDLAKQADKIIRTAERNMFSGKNDEAASLLQEAAALIEQGKADDPANKSILQAEIKLERTRTTVDKKLGKSVDTTSSSGTSLPEKPQPKAVSSKSSPPAPVAKQSDEAKLPGGVKKRLKDITDHLNAAERYADSDAKNAQYKLSQAEEIFSEIDKMYAGQFDPSNPDYAAVKKRYNELSGIAAKQGAAEVSAEAAAGDANVAKEKQSSEWLAKFREYLSYSGSEGYNPEKLVFVPGTSEPEKFADAKKRYEAFKTFYEDYKKADFPAGKTWALEDIADNAAPRRLKEFEEGFASRMGSVAERAESEINAAMAQLEKDNGWQSDKSIKPNLIDHKWMQSIGEETDEAVSALGAHDPKAEQIRAKFETLKAKDMANRQIRQERTFMTPDRYTGNDINALKEKAKALVKNNAKEGGTPLRCTISSENWREETVHEWTDTSMTEKRWRTTRQDRKSVV